MYIIKKRFDFSSAHQLHGLSENHPCSRLHGHNYQVIFSIKNKTLNEHDFVEDFRNLDVIKAWIDENLDHRNLNDVFDFKTTSENIAKFFFEKFKDLGVFEVEVKETEKTSSIYYED